LSNTGNPVKQKPLTSSDMKKNYVFLVLLLSLAAAQAQNLILNPGCDDTLVAGEIPCWTEITGNNWTQRSENPAPFAGESYFYPGIASAAELGQVIDISADSVSVDGGSKIYYFTGYVRAYAQSPTDESNIYILFRSVSDTLISDFIFGPYTQTSEWLRIDSALSAPPGSRKIDIRLHSERYNGSNNDGYYDELYLGNTPLAGVPEAEPSSPVLIYPNPSAGELTIKIAGSMVNCHLLIFDLSGRLVLQREVAGPVCEMDVRSLHSGIYILKLVNEKEEFVRKIILE